MLTVHALLITALNVLNPIALSLRLLAILSALLSKNHLRLLNSVCFKSNEYFEEKKFRGSKIQI